MYIYLDGSRVCANPCTLKDYANMGCISILARTDLQFRCLPIIDYNIMLNSHVMANTTRACTMLRVNMREV